MMIFATLQPGYVTVMTRAESEDGSTVGDLHDEVKPGGHFGNVPYAVLRQAGSGQHNYEEVVRRAADNQ